jgi:endonuclease/exonuclease/phosphatase family metal-dependent hydrolase
MNPYAHFGRVDERQLVARLETFARLVEEHSVDVLLCQEVGRGRNFRVDNWLAQRLAFESFYTRANGDATRFGREEGLAIFSRYPLSIVVMTLLAGGVWRRPALGAAVVSPLGEVMAYTTHHSLRPWRNRRQPAALRAWVEATSGGRTAVIGGDFNASDDAPQIAALRSTWVDAFRTMHPSTKGHTHELRLGGITVTRRIDYLFLCSRKPEIRIAKCILLDTGEPPYSDHRAVVARFVSH